MGNPYQGEFDSTRAAKMHRMGVSKTEPQRSKGEDRSGCTVSEYVIPRAAEQWPPQDPEDRGPDQPKFGAKP